jgi:hypothetical protein
MPLTRSSFKIYLFLACLAGYGWLSIISVLKPEEIGKQYDVCLVKHFFHIPCPSCGSSRSVVCLLRGEYADAFYWNPLGYLILLIMVVSPVWIVFDTLTGRDSIFRFYLFIEKILRKKHIALAAILFILLNWIWNIHKGI